MAFLANLLNQTAVYWAPATPGLNGRPTWGTPSEVSVRWEDRAEEFVDAQGEVAVSRARVFLNQDVAVNGVLLLSALDSSVDQSDPKANAGAWEVRDYKSVPNLDDTESLRVALL